MTTTPRIEHDVVVVGAGLTGLVLALSLADAGAQVTVMDRGTGEPAADKTRTTTINAASHDWLDQLDVLDALSRKGHRLTPVHRIRVSDDKTRPRPGLNVRDQLMEWQDDDAPLAWVFRNRAMEEALLDTCRGHPNITIMTGMVVKDFTSNHPQGGNAAAAVYTEDGAIHSARLVVAADGGGSPIRAAAGLRSLSRTPGQTAIVADVRTALPHRNMAWQRFLDGGPSALMPLDDPHLMALVWTLRDDDAASLLNASDHDFNSAMMDSFGDGFGALNVTGPRLNWVLKLNHVLKPAARRLVLAGDAAHSIHPLAGQGYNLALGDARCLARLMTDALNHGTDPGAGAVVSAYARERRLETAAMTMATDGLNAVFSFGGKNLVAATGMAMTVLNATPFNSLAMKLASGKMIGGKLIGGLFSRRG
ncbi:MAG: FAD-dependent oxidoreductase [Alphaproteobacteria bacterium]|nr:FAD-dependent oxidoreductase [Alphaproteobacteria bacterium]